MRKTPEGVGSMKRETRWGFPGSGVAYDSTMIVLIDFSDHEIPPIDPPIDPR
jgi:hypothetical protein